MTWLVYFSSVFLPVPSVQKVGSELNRERRAKEELEKGKKNEGRLFFPRQFFAGALLSESLEQATLSWLRGHQELLTLVIDSYRVGVGVVGVGTA